MPATFDQIRFKLVLVCLLLVAVLDQIPLKYTRWVEDESWYSDAGKTLLQEGRLRLSSFPVTDSMGRIDTRPPAMSAALALSFKVFGVGVWQARFPSYAGRFASILLVYFLARRYAGSMAGIIAAALLLTDNYLFVAARTARPEAMETLLMVLTLWLYTIARDRKSLLFTFLASLSATAALALHMVGFGVALGLGFLLLREFGLSTWRQPRAWCYALTLAAAIGCFAIWIRSTPDHYKAFTDLYISRASTPYSQKLHEEVSRYKDFIGLANQRIPLPFPVPLRLHVALALIASGLILWRLKRFIALDLLICIGANVLWWTYLVNKTSRYFSIGAPLFAILLAVAGVALWQQARWRYVAAGILLLVGVTQLAGNAYLLITSRKADYAGVTRSLRAIMPAGTSVYGITTFWMALQADHRYYSYDRIPFDYAITVLRPDYLILNDRVMMHGSGFGLDDFDELRASSNAFAHRSAALAGTVSSPFYGDLELYHVCYNGSEVRACAPGEVVP